MALPAARGTMSAAADVLHMYTIYESPRDFPGLFVVRRWTIGPRQFGDPMTAKADERPWAITETLARARDSLPSGLYNIARNPDDDTVIVETWV